MTDITLVVRITPKPEHREAFLARLRTHAENCRTLEPACKRFEVFVPRDGENRVFLVETYVGEDGLQAHRDSAHFQSYREDTNHMIGDREIVETLTESA